MIQHSLDFDGKDKTRAIVRDIFSKKAKDICGGVEAWRIFGIPDVILAKLERETLI